MTRAPHMFISCSAPPPLACQRRRRGSVLGLCSGSSPPGLPVAQERKRVGSFSAPPPPGLPVVQERKRSTWSDPSPPSSLVAQERWSIKPVVWMFGSSPPGRARGAGEEAFYVRPLPPRACPWRRRGSVLSCSAPPPLGLPMAQERKRVTSLNVRHLGRVHLILSFSLRGSTGRTAEGKRHTNTTRS